MSIVNGVKMACCSNETDSNFKIPPTRYIIRPETLLQYEHIYKLDNNIHCEYPNLKSLYVYNCLRGSRFFQR